ncbi:MAG: T9SS type A sorting domain-containing protein [candidate division WOR-3 bacterium]
MRLKIFILLWLAALPLFAQYNFSFVCTSDTFQTGTDYFVYYFRLTNTGTQPDSYAFDCRIIDTVPGWFAIYCAGGQCAEPGIILYDYLTPGAVDTGIDISIYTTPNVWGTEVINLKVWSIHNQNLRDSINVYAAMEQGIHGGKPISQPFKFEVYPNPFSDQCLIKFQNPNKSAFRNPKSEISLIIYDISGRVVKSFIPVSDIVNRESCIIWSGDDNFDRSVPEGIYFIEVNNGENKICRKVVKVK